MIIRPKQFAEELFSAISGANQKDADKITNQFVTALEKQNRLGMLDAIIKEYNKLLLKKNASPNVFIQSGQKVSKEIRNRVLNKMNIPEDVEVREEKENYVLSAELPGLDRNEIHVDVKNGRLTISGEKKHEKEEYIKKVFIWYENVLAGDGSGPERTRGGIAGTIGRTYRSSQADHARGRRKNQAGTVRPGQPRGKTYCQIRGRRGGT